MTKIDKRHIGAQGQLTGRSRRVGVPAAVGWIAFKDENICNSLEARRAAGKIEISACFGVFGAKNGIIPEPRLPAELNKESDNVEDPLLELLDEVFKISVKDKGPSDVEVRLLELLDALRCGDIEAWAKVNGGDARELIKASDWGRMNLCEDETGIVAVFPNFFSRQEIFREIEIPWELIVKNWPASSHPKQRAPDEALKLLNAGWPAKTDTLAKHLQQKIWTKYKPDTIGRYIRPTVTDFIKSGKAVKK